MRDVNTSNLLITLVGLCALFIACGDSGDDGDAGGSGGSNGAAACGGEPVGSSAGDALPDVELMDCDGNPYALRELCERELVWLVAFAGWCPNCRSFASSELVPLYERFSAEADLGAVVVITADGDFGAPTAAYCREVREQYGLEMPVLFDTGGAFTGALGIAENDVHVIATSGLEVSWSGHYASSQVEGQLEAAQSLGE